MMPNGLLTGVFSASCSVQRLSSGPDVRPMPAMVRTLFCCADPTRAAASDAVSAARNSRRVAIGEQAAEPKGLGLPQHPAPSTRHPLLSTWHPAPSTQHLSKVET